MSTETVYRCEYPGCGKELEYGGRGRPPKRCVDHKGVKVDESNGSKGEDVKAARPRPRPGKKEESKEPEVPEGFVPADGRSLPKPRPRPGRSENLPPLGKSDTGSRAKAETNAKRSLNLSEAAELEVAWPRGANGKPMAKIAMSASELIPTGQYANVSVGPAIVHAFVDLDREVEGDSFFSSRERTNLTKAINELAEVVERDVIAVQRMLVLESLADQQSADEK